MATHRYISTSYWDDAWIQTLNPFENLVFLHLMTNPLTGISGIYKITDRRISFDTKIGEEEVRGILKKFHDVKKALRLGEYIILPSWPKHQNWETSPKIKQGIINELMKLNDAELRFVYDCGYKFPMEEILKKRGIIVEKSVQDGYSMDTLSIEYQKDMEGVDIQDGYSDHTAGTIKLNSNSNSIKFNKEFIGNSIADQNKTRCEQAGDNFTEKPPPNLYECIKEKTKAHGYYIDDPVIKKIASSLPDSAWVTESHSIIDLAAMKIMEVYPDKTEPERKKLFISALIKWDNLKDEYPEWKKKKTEADDKRTLDKLRNNPPKNCPHCGATMEKWKHSCPSCGGYVSFNEDKRVWEYHEPEKSFLDKMNQKDTGKEDENIDF